LRNPGNGRLDVAARHPGSCPILDGRYRGTSCLRRREAPSRRIAAGPVSLVAVLRTRRSLRDFGYLLDFLKQPECANMLHDDLRKARPLPRVELEPHRRAKSKHWAPDKVALFLPAAIPPKKAARPLPVGPAVIMVELP
jgi:hypothetical protein